MTSETWFVIPALLLAGLTDAGKVELKPATTQAFDRYIQATEGKLDQRHPHARLSLGGRGCFAPLRACSAAK